MSSQQKLKINASIIHRIIKDINQQAPNITPPIIRQKLHSDDTQVEKLINFLDQQLDKSGLAHSFSKDFSTDNTMAEILGNFLFQPTTYLSKLTFTFNNPSIKFLSISNPFNNFLDVPNHHPESEEIVLSESKSQTRYRRLTNLLTHGLNSFIYEERMTTGDHLPIIFYEVQGRQYLYMALLSLKDNITINEDTGDIIDTTAIDTSALKVACKIDLDEMSKHYLNQLNESFEPKNYVSWIQKGTEKIAEYIQNFIPVEIRIDDKSATTKIMNTLTLFLKNSDFDNTISGEIHKDVLKLLKDKAFKKEHVNILEEIDPLLASKAITCNVAISSDKNNFKIYRENNGYGSNDKDNANIFAPEKSPLKNFEIFDIFIGDDSESLKISGFQSTIGNKIDFNDTDPTNPKLEILLTLDEAEKVRKVFNTAKSYESTTDN